MATISCYSKGLYSTWFFYRPVRTLFDCGEGLATNMGNFLYGIERVFLSHFHDDHTLGLPNLISCRNSARGDKEKPLDIYYPKNSRGIENLKTYIESRYKMLTFPLIWIPLEPGQEVILPDGEKSVLAFRTSHCAELSLGYHVCERRKRLKTEHRDLNVKKWIDKHKGTRSVDELQEIYHGKIFTYTLDSYKFDFDELNDTDLWVADTTFLTNADRDRETHMTLEEASQLAREYSIKQLIFSHFSPRYSHAEINRYMAEHCSDLNATAILPGRYYQI